MGNAESTTSEAGPGLTLSEKSSSSDSGLEAWLSGLSDRTNPARKAIVAVLCPAVFASTTMDKACDDLAQKLLDICDSKPKRRERMLQTPFVDGQTPVAWTICNLPDSLLSTETLEQLPPIVSVLLECCGERTPTLMDTVFGACCIRNTNSLFQLLNPYLKSEGSDTPLYHIKPANAYGSVAPDEFYFAINDFPTHMLSEGRIDMRFIHKSRLYSVGFVSGSTGEWMLFYRIVLDHGDAGNYFRNINLDLFHKGAHISSDAGGDIFRHSASYTRLSSPTRDVINARLRGSAYYDSTERETSAALLKNANPYVGASRELRGCIRLSK